MRERVNYCKRSAGTFAAALLALGLAACETAVPNGQVLAKVDGVSVTRRELEQERRSAPAAADDRQALDRLITRKILAEEARARGLEQDGEYHFALREIRERLLVEALRRHLARAHPVTAEQVAARIAAQPWRYRERFRLDLEPADTHTGNGPASLDSGDIAGQPSAAVLTARAGDTIVLDGRRWRVVNRSALASDASLLAQQARQALHDERSAATMVQVVANYRQSGKIRYQQGFGPSDR